MLATMGVLPPVLVLGGLGLSSVRELSDQILVERQAYVLALARGIDETLGEDLEILQDAASEPRFDLTDGDTRPEHAALRQAYRSVHSSGSVFLADRDGEILAIEPPHAALPVLRGNPFFADVLAHGRLVYTTHVDERGEGRVYALSPIRNYQGHVVGVLGIAVNPVRSDFADLLRAGLLEPDVSAALVDAEAHVLVSAGPAQPDEHQAHKPIIERLVRERDVWVGTCDSCHPGGDPTTSRQELLAAAALNRAPWVVQTRQPTSPALRAAGTLKARMAWTAVGLVAVAMLFAWGAAWSVKLPLRVLTRAAEGIAGGNLSAPIPPFGEDEIGRLATSLEGMRLGLHSSWRQLQVAREELEARVEQRTHALADANAKLSKREAERGALLHKIITTQEEERRRIARELHDETSQTLTALMIRLEMALSTLPHGDARTIVEDIKTLAMRTLDEVHRLVVALRPAVLDDLGLLPAIRWSAERILGPQGISVRYEFDPEHRLAPELEASLFRVAQEAIANIARHAGAESVLIQVSSADDRVRLEVEDDGCGFDLEEVRRRVGREPFGLIAMQERVTLLDGTLSIESAVGKGTRIVAEVPQRPGAAHA